MKKILSFLASQQQYSIIYLVISFSIFTVSWFVTRATGIEQVPYGVSKGSLARESGFEPGAGNVSAEASQQLDALRLRVVNAPEDTTHVFRLARMLQDAHQTDEAARNYKHYLALRPENRQAWLDYAQSLGTLSRWKEAEHAVEAMLVIYPEDPSGLYNLGAIYANQSRLSEAERIWVEVAAQKKDLDVAAMATSSMERLKSFVKPQWVAGK